jgi:hypothetical protein
VKTSTEGVPQFSIPRFDHPAARAAGYRAAECLLPSAHRPWFACRSYLRRTVRAGLWETLLDFAAGEIRYQEHRSPALSPLPAPAPGDGGVDLYREPDLARPAHGLQGPLVGARHAPERIVNVGRRSVQADGQPREAALLQSQNSLPRQQRCGARGERSAQALPVGLLYQLEDL